MKHGDFRFYTRQEYFAELTGQIEGMGAGDRAAVATMSYDPEEPAVARLLAVMGAAAGRGADVALIVDAYEFLLKDGLRPGALLVRAELPRRLPAAFAGMQEALERLQAAGGRAVIMNRPERAFSMPLAGRSHIKFALLNGQIFLGGCNLDRSAKVDIMVGWEDAAAARWLGAMAERMIQTQQSLEAFGPADLEHPLDAQTKILIDSGLSGRSLIMERALQLMEDAREHIFITCQFYPNDVTAQRLLAAHNRGVKVEIIYNHPDHHAGPYKYLHRAVVGQARRQQPKRFFVHEIPAGRPFLHAKVLVVDDTTMLGSHNFVSAGVRLGTAEIALWRQDADFARRAEQTITKQLAV